MATQSGHCDLSSNFANQLKIKMNILERYWMFDLLQIVFESRIVNFECIERISS